MLNICGCLISTLPDLAPSVALAIAAIEGCEVHATEGGRIVVTVEDTADKLASDLIMDLHQIPGVLTVTLSYHHFEELGPAAAQTDRLVQPTA